MGRGESVLEDENNRSTRYLRERATEVAMDKHIVQLYANLLPDPPFSAEDTKPKAEANGLPLTSDSHRAGWSPILLLNKFVILLVEIGHFLVFVMNRSCP